MEGLFLTKCIPHFWRIFSEGLCYGFAVLLTIFHFLSLVMLMDAMRSMDVSVSRASGSHTYHMLSDRLLVCLRSRLTCFLTCTIMDRQLVYNYVFCLHLLLLDRRLVYAYCSVLCLLFSTHLQSRYSWTLTHTTTRLPFTTLCTCISQSDIYTIGDGDLSLIFNLLCNHPTSVKCEIPHNSPPPF